MDLSSPLTRLNTGAGSLKAQARRFWDWWLGELLGLVPEAWRQRLGQRGALLLIELDGSQCRLRFGGYGNTEVLASAPLGIDDELPEMLAAPLRHRSGKAAKVLLRLPADCGLHKVIGLPAAAEATLGNVLRFEMDRHTPFNSEQVYFGYRVLKREADQQRLLVELQLVPRSYLDPLLQRLAALEVRPSRVALGEASDGGQPELWIDLRQPGVPGARGAWGNRRLLLWSLLLLGLAALLLLPLQQREHAAERLQQELAQPRALAERAAQVQQQLQQLEAGRDYLAQQQVRASAMLELLEELTRLLPDHTWLTRFEVGPERVRLEGESSEASSLIGLLEGSQRLHNVSFASPITSNPRTQRDRFSLLAERQPSGERP